MSINRRAICVVYGLIAMLALIGTWGQNIAYLHLGFAGANLRFWQDTLANPASRSITADLFLLVLALVIWMLFEARRLSMRGAWLYVAFGVLIAISVTFPIFMIQRERALARRELSRQAGHLSLGDVLGLLLLGVACCGYMAMAFMPRAA